MITGENRLSFSVAASSLTSMSDDDFISHQQVDKDDTWHRCEAIIPGVMVRHCQPGTDWTSARVRRVQRFLLIILPSLPLLVAALVYTVYLHQRYDVTLYSAKVIIVPHRMKLVHWPLMGGMLHLVQRGGSWGAAASVPITIMPYNGRLLCSFSVPIKGLT